MLFFSCFAPTKPTRKGFHNVLINSLHPYYKPVRCKCARCSPMSSGIECQCCHETEGIVERLKEDGEVFSAQQIINSSKLSALTKMCCTLHWSQ